MAAIRTSRCRENACLVFEKKNLKKDIRWFILSLSQDRWARQKLDDVDWKCNLLACVLKNAFSYSSHSGLDVFFLLCDPLPFGICFISIRYLLCIRPVCILVPVLYPFYTRSQICSLLGFFGAILYVHVKCLWSSVAIYSTSSPIPEHYRNWQDTCNLCPIKNTANYSVAKANAEWIDIRSWAVNHA